MKRTLTFESYDCDDESALRRALNADSAYALLWDIREELGRFVNGDIEEKYAEKMALDIIERINEDIDFDKDYS